MLYHVIHGYKIYLLGLECSHALLAEVSVKSRYDSVTVITNMQSF